MNQEVIEKKSLIDLLKANSKLITIFLIIVILGLSLFIWINHNNKNPYTWIICILNENNNFVNKIPFFSISITIKYKNQILLFILQGE